MIEGSSKRFIAHTPASYLMQFKDDIHGRERHDVIKGTGALRKAFTYHFYKHLEEKGLLTHLYEQEENALKEDGILVHRCTPIKLEILVRNVARGHWVDAHKVPLFPAGVVFDQPIVEFCLKIKKDGLDDPRVSPALILALQRYAKDEEIRGHLLLNLDEVTVLETLALEINKHYKELLMPHGWVLEDFKFEVGVMHGTRAFVLIDEISPDSSRIRDQEGGSLTKDLFRERRAPQEVYKRYLQVLEAVQCL